ncbi:MAG TPA: 16S rRNA (uracil(1498)-N(3))-methyltransferase [Verrucomicrobiae bacterium]|nr:16S rRNA (uracil(1498)-N(3))-methyltransferase [Verrucomicrobiae bacterium]
MARFFVPKENIRDGRATLGGAELEHMRRVLRLLPGDSVVLFDDDGFEHQGKIRAYAGAAAEIAIEKSYRPERESPLAITLAQALGKGDKLDLVVEKATELGVAAIAPFVCRRTVPKLDADAARRRGERWRRIALGAAKQSGRTRVPDIHELADFSDLVARPSPYDLKILFWESEQTLGLRRLQESRPELKSLLIVVGPEGGFTPEEAAEAAERGFQSVGLGRRILRTETAAMAAVALAELLWGDLG